MTNKLALEKNMQKHHMKTPKYIQTNRPYFTCKKYSLTSHLTHKDLILGTGLSSQSLGNGTNKPNLQHMKPEDKHKN